MISKERIKLIRFLAEHSINAFTFTDAEIRQQAQKIQSEQKMKNSRPVIGKESKKKTERKENKLRINKIPGK